MITRYKTAIIDLCIKIQTINNSPWNSGKLCFLVQQTILKKIVHVELKIQKLKSRIKEVNTQFKINRGTPNEIEKASKLNIELEKLDRKIKDYKHLLIVFRSLGDSLAFIYIDKYDIKQFIFKESAGYISGKEGLKLEYDILKLAFKAGGIALLNDLTNCLRHGDITLVRPDLPPVIIEAKTGTREFSKGAKQIEKTNKILDFLNSGETTRENHFVRRMEIKTKEIDNRVLLNALVQEALTTGDAFATAEAGLHYYLATIPKIENVKKIMASFNSQPISAFLDSNQMPYIGYYPLSLILKNPNAYFSFCREELHIVVFFEPAVIKQKFESLGFRIEFHNSGDYEFSLFAKDGMNKEFGPLNISKFFFGRMIIEFLSLDWFLNELVNVYRGTPLADWLAQKPDPGLQS